MRETWVQSLGLEDPLEKERLPTPVFWPGEFHGQYSPRGHEELDTTEQLSTAQHRFYNYSQFTDKGLDAQEDTVICPGPLS